MVDVLTALCARLYGKRSVRNQALRALTATRATPKRRRHRRPPRAGPEDKGMMRRTYELRLSSDANSSVPLDAYAALYGRAERTLFARLQAGDSLVALKREFLTRFGLTARQFNALAAVLRGKITSIRARRPG